MEVGGGVGKEFRATNGVLQGCPLSMILLNLLVSVCSKAIDAETCADPMAYADDPELKLGEQGPSPPSTALLRDNNSMSRKVWPSTSTQPPRQHPSACRAKLSRSSRQRVTAADHPQQQCSDGTTTSDGAIQKQGRRGGGQTSTSTVTQWVGRWRNY